MFFFLISTLGRTFCDFLFVLVLVGIKQASDPEGLGARHASSSPRVHARAPVPPAQQHPEDTGRADPATAPDGADQSAGVQQEERAGA